MTVELAPSEVAARIQEHFPEAQLELGPNWLAVDAAAWLEVARFLHDDPELDFAFLSCVTSIDRLDYFEVVYLLQSLRRNHFIALKVRAGHEDPVVPSVYTIWYGAHLQETEVYDMMGIRFDGHPNLRRLFLWEGFAGWPLRKDFLQVGRGAYHPGLPHFPKEGGASGLLNGPNWSAQPSRPAPARPGDES